MSSTFSSTSATASATAAADTQKTTGFLQNKALSVGVITASALVGLVLLAFLATWAIRKRRNSRINQEILDFSNAGLINDAHDVEKGGRFGESETVSATGHGSVTGHGGGSSSGHGGAAIPPSVLAQQYAYQDAGSSYPAMASYAPQPPPSRNANPYGAPPTYAYGAYQQPNNNWGYYNTSGAPTYDQSYGGVTDAYGGIAESLPAEGIMAGVGAGAQKPAQGVQRRPSAQRKPAPHLSISSDVAPNVQGPDSGLSLNNPPLQPAADFNNATPPLDTSLAGPAGRLVVSASIFRSSPEYLINHDHPFRCATSETRQ